jgi:ABC-type phosphate/phosphonate transport system permease subunit
MLVALIVTTQIQTLQQAFKFMISASAGLGGVLILRWYWWRVNAWSEIVATLAPFIWLGIIYLLHFYQIFILQEPYDFLIVTLLTTISWLIATFYTKPTENKKLDEFYHQIQPQGFWGKWNRNQSQKTLIYTIFTSFSATLLGYSILFCIGYFLFSNWNYFIIWAFVGIASLFLLNFFGKKAKVWS